MNRLVLFALGLVLGCFIGLPAIYALVAVAALLVLLLVILAIATRGIE